MKIEVDKAFLVRRFVSNMSMTLDDLQPCSGGELLRRSIGIVARHFSPIVPIVVLSLVPVFLSSLITTGVPGAEMLRSLAALLQLLTSVLSIAIVAVVVDHIQRGQDLTLYDVYRAISHRARRLAVALWRYLLVFGSLIVTAFVAVIALIIVAHVLGFPGSPHFATTMLIVLGLVFLLPFSLVSLASSIAYVHAVLGAGDVGVFPGGQIVLRRIDARAALAATIWALLYAGGPAAIGLAFAFVHRRAVQVTAMNVSAILTASVLDVFLTLFYFDLRVRFAGTHLATLTASLWASRSESGTARYSLDDEVV